MKKDATEPVVALVVAAGSGVRLGGQVPKALRLLGGRPLVAHAVDAMAAGGATHAIVVIAPGLESWFAEVLHDALVPVRLVAGGRERQESVRAGVHVLAADPELAGARVVLVHDAARPLAPAAVVADVIAAVRAGAPSVVPVVPVADTIRHLADDGSSTPVNRDQLRAVQTPQGFDRGVLSAGHEHLASCGLTVTDDAAACEALGYETVLVPGSRESLKITEDVDLLVAEAFLAARQAGSADETAQVHP